MGLALADTACINVCLHYTVDYECGGTHKAVQGLKGMQKHTSSSCPAEGYEISVWKLYLPENTPWSTTAIERCSCSPVQKEKVWFWSHHVRGHTQTRTNRHGATHPFLDAYGYYVEAPYTQKKFCNKTCLSVSFTFIWHILHVNINSLTIRLQIGSFLLHLITSALFRS